jgi:GNAT superfamily N-acetyltransferase
VVHSLRRARTEDAGAIAQVYVDAWRVAYKDFVAPEVLAALSLEERRLAWEKLIEEGEGSLTIVAATEDAEVSGFCTLFLPSRDDDADADQAVCAVAALYVAPHRSRKRIGRALMNAALEKATADGFEQVTVWVFEANASALTFYAGFGFAPDGADRRKPDQVGEIRLRLALV